jgi:two-component system, LytTR family, response regulator AlgR
MRVLIVDDEAPARARLRSLLDEIGGIEVAGEAADGERALQCVTQLKPDVLLLDIRMPRMDGIEVARHLALLPESPAVIFATAHDEHAMQAFDAQAIAYLLKPVRREKLAAALARAARLTRSQLGAVQALPLARTHVAVRLRDALKLIRLDDVLCFIAEQKYTTVRHAGGDDLIEDSLRTLETEFGQRFTRIHRNTLVATARLKALERDADGQYQVVVEGLAAPLAVSRRMATELRERLGL